MGSLTSSLLSASADKTAQDAENLKSSQDVSVTKPAQSSSQKTAVQKVVERGEKKISNAAKTGVKAVLGHFEKGGTVPKTGPYILHEGEEVIPANRASEYRKVYLGRKSKSKKD